MFGKNIFVRNEIVHISQVPTKKKLTTSRGTRHQARGVVDLGGQVLFQLSIFDECFSVFS